MTLIFEELNLSTAEVTPAAWSNVATEFLGVTHFSRSPTRIISQSWWLKEAFRSRVYEYPNNSLFVPITFPNSELIITHANKFPLIRINMSRFTAAVSLLVLASANAFTGTFLLWTCSNGRWIKGCLRNMSSISRHRFIYICGERGIVWFAQHH